MGRDQSNPKEMNRSKAEKQPVPGDITMEADDSADAQSRQRAIGRELRRWYDDITKEPVPDDLLDLLNKIDNRKED